MSFFLLAFPALLSIINPLSGAFIFLGVTKRLSHDMRANLARWVAIHSFFILNASIYIGAYVLEFFGISLPVLRVAGGLVISMAGWNLLSSSDEGPDQTVVDSVHAREASRIAFYPLTMPITTGPGTISVAVALGTNRPDKVASLAVFMLAATLVTAVLSLMIYGLYRNADRVSHVVGPTGTTIIVRLSAFLLFCIGIQVLWNGASELIVSVIRP
jgi:multiple antibiotic resistance protein